MPKHEKHSIIKKQSPTSTANMQSADKKKLSTILARVAALEKENERLKNEINKAEVSGTQNTPSSISKISKSAIHIKSGTVVKDIQKTKMNKLSKNKRESSLECSSSEQ